MDLQKRCACTVSAKKICSLDGKNESIKNHASTKCLGNMLSSSNNQGVAKVDKDLLCACENDKLVTLDGVVAMRDSMKPYAFKRIVCPQPAIKKC
ncbi:hypothetical protein ACI65C_002721 [Semiaphis heraclei]